MARDDGPSYVTIGDAARDEVAEFAHSRTVTAIAFAVAATLAAGLVGLRLIVEVKPPAL